MAHAKISFTLLGCTCLMVLLRLMHVVPTSAVVVVIGIELLIGMAFFTYALWPLWKLHSSEFHDDSQEELSSCARLIPILSERLPRTVAVALAGELRNLVAVYSLAVRHGLRVWGRREVPVVPTDVEVSIWRGPCGFLIPALVVDAAVVVLIMVNIPPAPWRIALDIAGIMGLVWLLSFVTSLVFFGHRVSRRSVLLRFGSVKWVTVAGEVLSVERHHQMATPALNHYEDGVFTCSVSGSTNLRILLADEAAVLYGDNVEVGGPVKEIRLAVDRPEHVVERFAELVA